MATSVPITSTKPANDPSIVNYLSQNGQKSDIASRGTLYTSTFGNSGSPYTGSASQNAALLHALQNGHTSAINNGNISGSSSVKSTQNTQTAMDSASKSIAPTATPPPTTSVVPPPPITASTSPVSNPVLNQYQTATSTAMDQAHQDSAVALKPITDTYNQNLQTLQTSKANALAAAKATYAKANPYGVGSDQDEFLSGIEKSFNTQIQNLQTSYGDTVTQNSQQLQDNINNINQTYQANVQAYRQNQMENLQWTLANNPPEPLNTKNVKNEKDLDNALLTWGAQNSDLIDTAFSTGQYGDEDNKQDYLNVAAMLSHPSKATIEEQTALANVGIAQQRLGIEAAGVGIAQQNANTSAANASATTQSQSQTRAHLFGIIPLPWKNTTTSTSTKIPGVTSDNPAGI